MEIAFRLFVHSVKRVNKHSLIQRSIMTSSSTAQKYIEELENSNPYFEKYAKKIAKLQKTSPEEFLSRVEEQAKTKQVKNEPPKERNFSSLLQPKKSLESPAQSEQETLDSIMKVDLVKDKSVDEIKEIWLKHHLQKDVLAAIIPTNVYDKIIEQSKETPVFIFPLPRSQGYEFIMSQFQNNSIHFTPLICYQIITATVNKLLKSKILLDEDEEIINAYVELITINDKDIKKCIEDHYSLINKLCSKLNFTVEITVGDILISAVCAIPHALMEIQLYYACYQFRNYGKLIDDLITICNENLLLIVQIEKYFQERELFLLEYKTKVDNDELYNLIEAPEQKFKSHVVNRVFKTVLVLQEEVKENVAMHGKIIEMYDIVLNVELNNLMTAPDHALAECVKEIKYLYILFMSNFWGSLVLKLILNISKCNEFYKAMDTCVKVSGVLKANHEDIKKNYNDVRKVQNFHKKQDKDHRSLSNRANIVRMKKIHEIQLFFKIGSDMAHTLENFITDNEKFELQVSFLMDHLKKSSAQTNALEYIKPQRSASNQVAHDGTEKKVPRNTFEEEKTTDDNAKIIRYDEPDPEGSDEEYECIANDEEPHQIVTADDYDDHVKRKSDYAQMMQELGTALAMVRKRRAIKKGVAAPIAAPRTSVTKDMDEPIATPRTNVLKVERSFIEPVVPSFPKIQIPSLTSGLYFAHQVAMEARKRNMVEEQFGCSGDEEEEGNQEEDKDSLVITTTQSPSES